MDILGILLAIAGSLAVIGLAVLALLRARALDRRIQEHFAEEEAGPKDPYAQMAELLRVDKALRRQTQAEKQRERWPEA